MLDAKVAVDRYTQAAGGESGPAKTAMREAMALYAFAGRAWSVRITRDYEIGQLADDSALGLCPPVQRAAEAQREFYREIAVVGRVEMLWECAAQRGKEAARLLAEE
jgi:hypothetical protein